MMATAFDTLKTYEAITAAGLDDKAARAISNAIADSATAYRADLVTKADLAGLKAELKSDLAGLKAELKSDIAELRAELKGDISGLKIDGASLRELIASTQNKTIVWMFGMLVTFSGIIIGVIKLT